MGTEKQPLILAIVCVAASATAAHAERVGTAVEWDGRSTYYFRGDSYLHHKAGEGIVEEKPIAGSWGCITGAVDAAASFGKRKLYLFSGASYARYDMDRNACDDGYPKPIAGNWIGVPWTRDLDAVVAYNGKAYFFEGAQYVRFDIAADRADPGYPKAITAGWPGVWRDGVDAAVNTGNGKVLLFKGEQVISYDIATERADGPARPIGDVLGTAAPATPPPPPPPPAAIKPSPMDLATWGAVSARTRTLSGFALELYERDGSLRPLAWVRDPALIERFVAAIDIRAASRERDRVLEAGDALGVVVALDGATYSFELYGIEGTSPGLAQLGGGLITTGKDLQKTLAAATGISGFSSVEEHEKQRELPPWRRKDPYALKDEAFAGPSADELTALSESAAESFGEVAALAGARRTPLQLVIYKDGAKDHGRGKQFADFIRGLRSDEDDVVTFESMGPNSIITFMEKEARGNKCFANLLFDVHGSAATVWLTEGLPYRSRGVLGYHPEQVSPRTFGARLKRFLCKGATIKLFSCETARVLPRKPRRDGLRFIQDLADTSGAIVEATDGDVYTRKRAGVMLQQIGPCEKCGGFKGHTLFRARPGAGTPERVQEKAKAWDHGMDPAE